MAQGIKEEAEEAKRMVASIGQETGGAGGKRRRICSVRSAKECW